MKKEKMRKKKNQWKNTKEKVQTNRGKKQKSLAFLHSSYWPKVPTTQTRKNKMILEYNLLDDMTTVSKN